jgi:hypothetical protein
MSSHAEAAKAIRQELKEAFPSIKFYVRSNVYPGGNSVDVYWEGDPSIKDIYAIIDKYQKGHFNSMDDSYYYSNIRKDIPQVRYVFANNYKP